jgi:nucleoid-associated protein YgaU
MQHDWLTTTLKFLYLRARMLFVLAVILIIALLLGLNYLYTQSASPDLVSPSGAVVTRPFAFEKEIEPTERVTELPIETYNVQAGDSSWSVAELLLGDGRLYPAIEKLNGLAHNQYLEIGQILRIPSQDTVPTLSGRSKITPAASIEEAATEEALSEQTSKTSGNVVRYEVQQGDCLWTIAEQNLDSPYSWVQVYEKNRQTIGTNPDLIHPGTVLLLSTQ